MKVTADRSECEGLLERYGPLLTTNPDLDRTLVSFQANRNARFFGWLKYREGFSAALARAVIERYSRPGDVVLDPFAGVGTTAFVARSMQRSAAAIELLPVGVFAIEARLSAEAVAPATFRGHVEAAAGRRWAAEDPADDALRHIPITVGAFPERTERALAGYRAHCRSIRNPHVRRLFHLAALAVLESVSFTRKDGQYLRWDCRADRPRIRTRFNKGRLAEFDDAITEQLRSICADIETAARDTAGGEPRTALDLRQGSCLGILPELEPASVDLVLTSPPYCNRYDYTRTYALELVFLGLGDRDVKRLRQAMLSCTVENGDKLSQLRAAYRTSGRTGEIERAVETFTTQAALQEVLGTLDELGRQGALNNANIPRMVRNYFLEMSVVIMELTRLLRPGGRVVMVNDNVRYAGHEIPVDLILSDLAAGLGLEVESIWALARGKGNSSQQMGVHGRQELRKCVYVWRKAVGRQPSAISKPQTRSST